jgi:alpha-2-macroglobulin
VTRSAAFYSITVTEVPREVPVRPEGRGLVVERWYEAYEGGRRVTEVNEGDLVRVRLRLTVPDDRSFVVLDDALPAGLEAVDLSLRTVGGLPGPGAADSAGTEQPDADDSSLGWWYGSWDSGWWSPFEHREIRDDRVIWSARVLWRGTYNVTYVARATTPGVFVRPPAHAEEMYNPAVFGRSDGGTFTVRTRGR